MSNLINTTEDKKKLYAARTLTGIQMKDVIGAIITCIDIVQFTASRSETEEPGICTVLFDADGTQYSTMSPTASNCVESAVAVFGVPTPESPITFKIATGKSKSNRDFLQLEVL